MSDIRANTISDAAGTGPITLTKQSATKAWITMDSSAVILDSFNVSSTSDDGVGDYSITFSNSFSSVNYSGAGTCKSNTEARSVTFNSSAVGNTGLRTWTNSTGAAVDSTSDSSFQGDLA